MFRFKFPAAPLAAATLLGAALISTNGFGQAAVPDPTSASSTGQTADQTPTSQSSSSSSQAPAAVNSPTPQQATIGRRRNLSRQARIERNIRETYSHKYEIAGGGGFLRFRTGPTLQQITQINFFMDGTRMFGEKWGVLASVRGMYGNANIPNELAFQYIFRPKISEYTFMAGVQRRFIEREKWTVSGNATAGTALSKFAGDAKGLRSTDLGMWPDSNAKPVFQVGVSFDYNLYNNFAARIEPTYLGTTFGNTLENNKGINFGLVYRFGHQ